MNRILLTIALMAGAAAGCGKSDGPATVPVSGTVYLDGAPAEGVSVHFVNEIFSSHGKTDAEGRYELTAGAVIGESRVYFSKMSVPDIFKYDPEGGMDEGQLMAMADPRVSAKNAPKQLIPPQFSDPTKTKVTFIVSDGGAKDADFKLPSK